MVSYEPERTRRGWRLTVAGDGEAIVLEIVGFRVRDGAVRASVTVRRGEVVISQDLITLTRQAERLRFVEALGKRGVPIPEQALVALDIACRESSEAQKGDGEPKPDPAPGPARPLGELLEATIALLKKYVVFQTEAQPLVIAFWVTHTHTLTASDVTPYLLVRSPEKRSAKTRVLELLERLVARPWRVVEATAPAIFRKIKRDEPTILLDEVDAIFKGKASETSEALRGVLNAGYRRGASVPRCTGKNFENLEDFPVFCSKALAGIGRVPDTIADRCIPITLIRKKRSEQVARFRFRTVAQETALLQRALAVWGEAAVHTLRDARPELPESLDDRAAEISEPLLAIADAAGGNWPARARAALELLHQAGAEHTESSGVMLLAAIRDTFNAMRASKVLTVDLLAHLVEREGEPWPGWWGVDFDKAMKDGVTPKKPSMDLARHLRGFAIQPKQIRVPDDRAGKGYDRADFEDAFARYLGVPNVAELFQNIAQAAAEYASRVKDPPEGRNVETTVAPQGFSAFRPSSDETEVGTAQTVAAHGLSQRFDLEGDTCVVCGLDAAAWSSNGEAWCAGCWQARVVTE